MDTHFLASILLILPPNVLSSSPLLSSHPPLYCPLILPSIVLSSSPLSPPAYLDVGYSHDHARVVTEVITRCGNPTDRTAIEVAVFPDLLRSGKNFCPEAYPQFVGAVQNAEGAISYFLVFSFFLLGVGFLWCENLKMIEF